MAHYNDSESSDYDEEPWEEGGAPVGSLADGGASEPYKDGPDGDGSVAPAVAEMPDGKEAPSEPTDTATMTARAYQREMLEESLKRNIIVAMDTGSGKTEVAILRIKHELDHAAPEKRIWFLAPTVSLCVQQSERIDTHIPGAPPRLIIGADGVDNWSDQETWDNILLNVRIVVSSYQVLLDALSHGFVRMESLALIIFDEAHNCTKKHPGSKIMQSHYWPAKKQGREIPHILGLTASPIIRSRPEGLEELEATLDAVCKSPNKHRDELLTHVNRPLMHSWPYRPRPMPSSTSSLTRSMLDLQKAYEGLDLATDPYVLQLKSENTERSRRKLERALMRQDTYVQNQMNTFCRRSVEICRDLGQWAADWYIHEAIRRFLSGKGKQDHSIDKWNDFEARYLANVLNKIDAPAPKPFDLSKTDVSDKVLRLIEILVTFPDEKPRGIVFVKDRATTVVLSHVLSSHPEVSRRYRVGTMVGTSMIPGRKHDFLDLSQSGLFESLESFRKGTINLLVATSVLEEGIDVPACNLVVCMEDTGSLKSFIQRRGRARMRASRLYLLLEQGKANKEWETLEKEMKQRYEDDMRTLREIESIEESEVPDFPDLFVASTNARLTIDDAKSHLEHFCSTMTFKRYVDLRPDYIITQVDDDEGVPGGRPLQMARVLLPNCLPPELREFKSSRAWKSEKNAMKDAAFQAYAALYNAGLVNDHLMPLRDSDLSRDIESRQGLMMVKEQLNPWVDIAQEWLHDDVTLHRRQLHLTDENGSLMCQLELVLPVPIPDIKPVQLHWDHHTAWTLALAPDVTMTGTKESSAPDAQPVDAVDHTSVLLALGYGHRWEVKDSHCVIRLVARDASLSLAQIGSRGFDAAEPEDERRRHLVRDAYGTPYIYQGYLPAKPPVEAIQEVYRGFEDSPDDAPYLVLRRWPKKTGFFHQPPAAAAGPNSRRPYQRVLPAAETRVDAMPLVYAQAGLLIPSIINYLESYLVASRLLEGLHASGQKIAVSDVSLVATAISASSARGPTNYERIEFLGDSLLKLLTTVNVSAKYPHWPEGLLSLRKDKIVSNSRLCRAAIQAGEDEDHRGLDRFIITRQLRLDKWRPPYIEDLAGHPGPQERELSTKTLADVVEALIGASYINGGFPAALQTTRVFLPHDTQWRPLEEDRAALLRAAPASPTAALPPGLEPLEPLLGYTFRRKALLAEAMTHPSYTAVRGGATLDRLEFLGDAILDHIVVSALFARADPPLEHFDMHLLRAALVNSDILGFLVMEWATTQQRFDPVAPGPAPAAGAGAGAGGSSSSKSSKPALVASETVLPLWAFMRHSSSELALEQQAAARRHAAVRGELGAALRGGGRYPWALLARLRAPKFHSDLLEALVGAVWADSGSLAACEALVERAGVLPCLRRLLRDRVHVLHPREELGRVADQEAVRYETGSAAGGPDAATTVSCRVLVGKDGRVVAEVGGALFAEEARTLAAMEAIEALKAERAQASR